MTWRSAVLCVRACGGKRWQVFRKIDQAFAALLRYRDRREAFLAVWAGGILARLAVVLAGAYWVMKSPALQPAPALLSLAGFLFVLLLMEPVFFIVRQREG